MGIFYAFLSGMMVLVEGPVLRKALRKFSEEILIVIGSIILGANFIRSYPVNVSATSKNTFKHLFPSISLSSDVVNKLECLCINPEIVFVDAHELCHP
jgi:hypothetical protein